jgi:LysR family transcriptional regulator, glycine cleavage system transcriptional activator
MPTSLTALRAFETAARHLSFKAAANELNLSATAISHQVRSLEKALGHQLFYRQVRQVALTAEGEELVRTLTPAFRSIHAAVDKLTGQDGRHTVTLGTGPIFGSRWLAPRLGLFWQQNPDIDLRLHHSPLPVHQQMARYDMAVAWGINDWLGLQADPLLSVHVTPVYAPNAEFAHAEISDPKALLALPLLHHRDHSGWRQWLATMGVQSPEKLPGIIFEDANVQLQAALEGQGIALGILPLIADEISTGRLIQPWEETVEPLESYYLLYQHNSLARSPVARVHDWLLSIESTI